MIWIKYKIVQSVIDGEPVLVNKKVGYSDKNIAIAEKEAYDGYEIVEDNESFDKKPLGIEFGGTGAKNTTDALKNLANGATVITNKNISNYASLGVVREFEFYDSQTPRRTYTTTSNAAKFYIVTLAVEGLTHTVVCDYMHIQRCKEAGSDVFYEVAKSSNGAGLSLRVSLNNGKVTFAFGDELSQNWIDHITGYF